MGDIIEEIDLFGSDALFDSIGFAIDYRGISPAINKGRGYSWFQREA